MKKENLMPGIVLSAICIAVALLLSVVNLITAPVIAEVENQKTNEALLEVLPEGSGFTAITVTDAFPSAIKEGFASNDGGYVFKTEVSGKSSGLIIMFGISKDGKIVGTKVISTEETKEYAARVFPDVEGLDGKYKDMTLDAFDPYLVSGATLTSSAYGDAAKAALQAFAIAGGANVDTRTPEEILQDNCNAALGTEGLTFVKLFRTESVSGIDEIYTVDKTGSVYVIGDRFIGIKADGTVVTQDASEEDKAAAIAADTVLKASVLTKITEAPSIDEKLLKKYVEAYVTASGNYVITAKGAGFGKTGDEYYYPSGKYMEVKIAISADGKIIDSEVVFEEETPDYGGAALKKPEFIGQFEGKDASNYNDQNFTAGATATLYGYKDAIKTAFAAYEAFKGGN